MLSFIYLISQDKESVVTCLEETRHSFQTDDYVTFTEVEVSFVRCILLFGTVAHVKNFISHSGSSWKYGIHCTNGRDWQEN